MDTETLMDIGLTAAQAKAYIVLVQHGSITPPDLAKKTRETRTNAYKVLDKLCELGLASKSESGKKIVYRVGHPVALERLAKKQRDQALEQEKRVRLALPTLLNYFYTYSEQPGVRLFQGADGIKEIFNDMLRTRQPIYLIRSPADVKFYDENFFANFRSRRAKLGIETHALTVDVASAVHDADADTSNRFYRTWLPADAYTGSVEWDVYGDKLAIISYGEEAIGMIVESPQIADSFRQLFQLIQLAYAAP